MFVILALIITAFMNAEEGGAICYLTRNNTRITCSVKIGENDTTLSFTVRKCDVLTLWVYVDVRTSAFSWSSSTSHDSPTPFIVPSYEQGPFFRSRNETFKIELLVSLYRTEADPRLKVELNYWGPNTRLKNDKGPTGEIINRYLPIYCTKVKISFKDPCKVSENDRGTTEVGCRIAMGQNDTSLIMQVSHCDSDKLTYNINLFTKTSYATVEYSKIKTFDRNYMFLPKQEHPLFRIGNTTFMIFFYVKLNKSDFGVRLQVRLIYLPRHGGSHVIENFIDVPIKCGWWDSLHTGLKVLVIGAPLLFLLLLIIILVWWCHRKKCSPVSRRWSPQNSN